MPRRRALWVIGLALLATGCPDDDITDGGVDAGASMDAGPPPPRCGDGNRDSDEVCDDGNEVDGDGCSATCASDESCGNGIVDAAADELCDDGNNVSGDGCGPACRSDETCGNSVVDLGVGERCDDGNTTAGDGCSADCTSEETCGNGVLDPSEACDDGNTLAGDGCDATCAVESCSTPADCDDGEPCSGVETCDAGVCARAAPLADGDACDADADPGTRDVCVFETCVASACGDRFLDAGASPPEQCDDGDTDVGDGCGATCQLESCTMDGDCDDENQCTTGHVCVGGTCQLGVARADGAACDLDMDGETRDLCVRGFCQLTACGDRYIDRSFGEECDDGNTVSGDGCEADCTLPLPVVGFRVIRAELIDPHIYGVIGARCQDITGAANSLLEQVIDRLELNLVGAFFPLDPLAASTPLVASFNADCDFRMGREQCELFYGPGRSVPTVANNTLPASASCFDTLPGTLNPTYAGVVNRPGGPCFVTPDLAFTFNLGGVPIPLVGGRLSATYGGGLPPTRLVSGVLAGFLSLDAARMTRFDGDIPVLGGDTLYEHLADGSAPGSACVGMSFSEDDSDTRDGQPGYWFYVNFEASPVALVP